jgi:hypothetical protein
LPVARDGPWPRVPASARPHACGDAIVARPPPATSHRRCRPTTATCRPRAPCLSSPYLLPCRAVAHLSTHSHTLIHLCSLWLPLLTCRMPHLSITKLRLNSDHLPDPSSASNDRWSAPTLPVSHLLLLPHAPHHGQPLLTLLRPGRHLLEDRVVLLMLPGPRVNRPDNHTEPLSPFPSNRNPPPLITLLW